jgi:hypothetical protein
MRLRWDQLWDVLRRSPFAYFQWLFANLGGLIVAYSASGTIWLFHNNLGPHVPGPEVYLITGTIPITVTGVSYLSLPRSQVSLSPLLTLYWPFILAAVYGVLIAMGVKPPIRSSVIIWLFVGLIFLLCLAWSTVTWLHERGIRMEMEDAEEPTPPEGPPAALTQAAANLPKS